MELLSLHINSLLRRNCIKVKKENHFRGILTLAILSLLFHFHQWVSDTLPEMRWGEFLNCM